MGFFIWLGKVYFTCNNYLMKKIRSFIRDKRTGIGALGIVLVGVILLVVQTHVSSQNTLKKAAVLQRTQETSQPADTTAFANYQKPSDSELRSKLTPEQYDITQKDGTETPFKNLYWHSKEVGIYVDVVSGEPLFSSREKYDSGTGWPSFTKPISAKFVTTKQDTLLGYSRVEVRSKYANSHLGHLFDDGPTTLDQSGGADPTGLRYCMNSASLRFVPKAQLSEQGLSAYESLL